MNSQEFLGKNQLIERLTSQVGDKAKAISILQKRGHLEMDGKTFTEEGLKRDNMTAAERAIDRASNKLGEDPSLFLYDQLNNTANKIKNF
jgi:hypothetical protein